jgi:hypothetical protein
VPKRQIVLMRSGGAPGEAEPLGSLRDVLRTLALFNISPDGSSRKMAAMEVAHGPGMVVELPALSPQVTQAMVTMTDEEFAFPVLSKLCRAQGWTMVDLETGRSFGG